MKWSHSVRPINQPCLVGSSRGRAGFTIAEFLVAGAVLSVVGLIATSMLMSGLTLFSENISLNLSGLRARQGLDHLNDAIRFGETVPELISENGTVMTASTAPGVLCRRYLCGPYSMFDSAGTTSQISDTATQFQLKFTTNALAAMSDPEVGDFLLVDLPSRPELEVTAVTVVQAGGGSTPRALRVTTAAVLGEIAKPASYRVGAYRIRREAYVMATPSGSTTAELRYYRQVRSSTNFSSTWAYRVIGTGFRANQSQPYFQKTVTGGLTTIQLAFEARSSPTTEYMERITGRAGFTTVPLSATLRNLGN